MSKFYGTIGFAETVQTTPGVWKEQITERNYYCELLRNRRVSQSSDQVNDSFNVANEISIISDPYVDDNIRSMRYVEFMGAKWKVSNIDVRPPRLILTLGGLYNE